MASSKPAPFIPIAVEANHVLRFVGLVQDLTARRLADVEPAELAVRDRPYVHRLRLLASEEPGLIARQRVVWFKLLHAISLLESEARELIEVLACRGFYPVGLRLDGMAFCTLDMSGAVIGGDYSCQHTVVRGLCDETGLMVRGRHLIRHRIVQGEWLTQGLT
ncbi:hypothetical protein ACFL5O_11740, partial [Myxococcota bacterium]